MDSTTLPGGTAPSASARVCRTPADATGPRAGAHRALDENDLVRARELCARLSIGRSTLWRLVSAGQFPRPLKLGPNTTAWRWRDVQAHLDRLAGDEGGERGATPTPRPGR